MAEEQKKFDPYFPAFMYSVAGKRQFNNVEDLARAVEADGPGYWFDSPALVPQPEAKPDVDWKGLFEEEQKKNAELRQVNMDLVAKLMAAVPDVPAKAAKATKAEKAEADK